MLGSLAIALRQRMHICMQRTFIFLLFLILTLVPTHGADAGKPLEPVAVHALAQGTDATLNPFFLRTLGISAEEGRPLALKRLRDVQGNQTNFFDVSVADKQTVVLTTREGALSHYYVTDVSGNLRKAVVNDSKNRNAGLTSLPNAKAQESFERAKQFWLTRHEKK
jgi:hypothetical protein